MTGAVRAPEPFVTALRTPRGAAREIGGAGGERITVRVQFEALWDAIALRVRTDEPVATLLTEVLTHFGLAGASHAEFVVKLRGWEVRGAEATIATAGARDGSTFLVAHRFRRPVR